MLHTMASRCRILPSATPFLVHSRYPSWNLHFEPIRLGQPRRLRSTHERTYSRQSVKRLPTLPERPEDSLSRQTFWSGEHRSRQSHRTGCSTVHFAWREPCRGISFAGRGSQSDDGAPNMSCSAAGHLMRLVRSSLPSTFQWSRSLGKSSEPLKHLRRCTQRRNLMARRILGRRTTIYRRMNCLCAGIILYFASIL